jgi:hypothetical protein
MDRATPLNPPNTFTDPLTVCYLSLLQRLKQAPPFIGWDFAGALCQFLG